MFRAACLALFLLLPLSVAQVRADPGDINGDGKLGVTDALIGLRILSGLTTATPANLAGGDLNGDGKIDITEVLKILRVVAGLAPASSLGGGTTPPPPPSNQPGITTLVGDPKAWADGPRLEARFQAPEDVALGRDGSLYVADRYNHRIRKVDPQGNVTTLAGTGVPGYRDGAPNVAQFDNPIGIAVDANGVVYVADTYNQRIRTVQPDGTVSTLAGNPALAANGLATPGFLDGPAATALFSYPWALDVDARGGVYVADRGNDRIRYISPQKQVTTVAGSTSGFEDNVPGDQAKFREPTDVRVAPDGRVWITDGGNHLLRYLDTNGNVGTLAGHPRIDVQSGLPMGGFRDGAEPVVQFNFPLSVDLAPDGSLYVVDGENWRIRRVDSTGGATTIAGGDFGGLKDGPGTEAWFFYPSGIATDAAGAAYVADSENGVIRRIDPDAAHTTSTFAGVPVTGTTDGPGDKARLLWPQQIALDSKGTLYIADAGNDRIRMVLPTGEVKTLAGSTAGLQDGPVAEAKFQYPSGVAVDPEGNVYVADSDNQRIRKITPDGVVSTLAGGGDLNESGFVTGSFNDAVGTDARFDGPAFLRWGPDNALYVADTYNNRIRRVAQDGTVTTVAGGNDASYKDGTVEEARFAFPNSLCFGPDGTLYVADTSNQIIRAIKDGKVTTLAGNPPLDDQGFPLDDFLDGPANQARFGYPMDVAADAKGNVYVTDFINNRIRRVGANGTVSTIVGTARNGHRDGTLFEGLLRRPMSVVINPDGQLLVGEMWNHRVRRIVLQPEVDGEPVLR